MSNAPALGRISDLENGGQEHHFDLPVYWEDTDAGGIVYYANYLKFTERARTDLLRLLGIHQQEMMEKEGLNFVVRECHIDYLKSAKLDDLLVVKTRLGDLKGATLRMYQDIYCATELLIRSEVRVACLGQSGKPARFSPQIKDKFASMISRREP